MSEDSEQNKTEDPTPFKLRKAREKGNVAKGTDIAFFAVLMGLAFFMLTYSIRMAVRLSRVMESSLIAAGHSQNNQDVYRAIELAYQPALWSLVVIGAIVFIAVLLGQIIQVKGLLFTPYPMKPDFTRLNPAKGLKRIFSMKTLKETLKNCFKMLVYIMATFLVIRYCLNQFSSQMTDIDHLIKAINSSALRLLYTFLALALIFAAIDQVITRKEFFKQMRMSKSELKREVKDREGEPRIKQKRKQLHEEFAKQTASIGNLEGSDVIITNPQHYAIALSYNPDEMNAPKVIAKGRNKFAQQIKSRAFNLGIPIISNPPLARALFRKTQLGNEIPTEEFYKVANIYIKLRQDDILKTQSLSTPDNPI